MPDRGLFTGNRGCLFDDDRRLVRHHLGNLWITCVTRYKDWRSPLDQPHRWTPIFFLDDAVALAAGHRPCGLCRRDDYHSYQVAVTRALGATRPVPAVELNRRLAAERLRRGRGLDRAGDRKTWPTNVDRLPDGVVIVDGAGRPRLVSDDSLLRFTFHGWADPMPRPRKRVVEVLTPPTSTLAIDRGYRPRLHPSALR